MRIGSTISKRVDGNTPFSTLRERNSLSGDLRIVLTTVESWWRELHLDMTLIKMQSWLWLLEVNIGWNLSILQDKDSFQQAGNTARGFKMPNVGFDRSNIDVSFAAALCTENFCDG